nr:PREDICTED: centrosomal protein of 135 kDa-like isoform X2 [Bemisia tabaci]
MCCDTQKNLRYQKLRSQLNDLGYLQPLSKDSLLLVEHLLADYLHTSQKLKYYKETAHNSIQACRNLEISVEPYKSDNAKLVTQLNCLHNQILEEKTHFEERIHGLKLQVKKVEAERSDLEDLVSLQTNRIQVLEHESQLKNERLLQLQGLDLKPIITTAVGSKKRSAPLAKKKSFTRLEIDPGVESVKDWQTYYSEINRLNEDPVVVDLVILTEKRIESLQKTINDVEAEKQYLEEELELCATKISDRDVEIDRLQKLLGSGRPAEAVNREFYTEGTLEGASDMNANMDNCSNSTVNSKTLFLQQRLEEAIEKQHEAMCTAVRLADHNRLLEAQLKCAVESRCHCSTPPEDGTSERCKTDATETEHVQQNFLQCMTELNRRVDELMADNDSLRKCAEKGAEERKKLTNKVNELTAIENKLQQEITKLSRVNAAQKAKIVDFEERKAAFCRSCRKTSTEDLPKCSSGICRRNKNEEYRKHRSQVGNSKSCDSQYLSSCNSNPCSTKPCSSILSTDRRESKASDYICQSIPEKPRFAAHNSPCANLKKSPDPNPCTQSSQSFGLKNSKVLNYFQGVSRYVYPEEKQPETDKDNKENDKKVITGPSTSNANNLEPSAVKTEVFSHNSSYDSAASARDNNQSLPCISPGTCLRSGTTLTAVSYPDSRVPMAASVSTCVYTSKKPCPPESTLPCPNECPSMDRLCTQIGTVDKSCPTIEKVIKSVANGTFKKSPSPESESMKRSVSVVLDFTGTACENSNSQTENSHCPKEKGRRCNLPPPPPCVPDDEILKTTVEQEDQKPVLSSASYTLETDMKGFHSGCNASLESHCANKTTSPVSSKQATEPCPSSQATRAKSARQDSKCTHNSSIHLAPPPYNNAALIGQKCPHVDENQKAESFIRTQPQKESITNSASYTVQGCPKPSTTSPCTPKCCEQAKTPTHCQNNRRENCSKRNLSRIGTKAQSSDSIVRQTCTKCYHSDRKSTCKCSTNKFQNESQLNVGCSNNSENVRSCNGAHQARASSQRSQQLDDCAPKQREKGGYCGPNDRFGPRYSSFEKTMPKTSSCLRSSQNNCKQNMPHGNPKSEDLPKSSHSNGHSGCKTHRQDQHRSGTKSVECRRKISFLNHDDSFYKPPSSGLKNGPTRHIHKFRVLMPSNAPFKKSNSVGSVLSTDGKQLSKPTKTSPGKTYRKNDKVLHKVGSRAPKSLYNMAGNRRKSCADMNSLESKEDSESADQLGNLLASEEYRTGNGESTSLHDEVKKLIEEERRKYEEQIEFVRRQQAEHCARLHPPPYLISDKIKETINQAPSAVLELLLAEKNYYQKEYHRLLDKQLANEKDGVGDGNQGPTSKSSEKIIEQIQSEIQKSTNETLANLITKLNEKDKEIIDLKLSIEKLSSERGRGDYYNSQNLAELMAKLNEKDKEIMDLKYSIQKSSLEKGKGDYLDTQNALIRSLELERDLAKREVKRLEEEKAALWSQLSNIREGHRLGENRMSQLSIDFEDRLRKLESERCELLNKQTSQTLIIENFEREIDQYRKSLVQSQQDLTEQKALYNHMKLAHEQAERALRDCHSNQGHLNKELSANLDRIQALESEVTTLDRELQNVKIERNTLRTNLKQLDQQKDFLLCKLDDKTERIASMEKEIMKNETVLRQYETTIAELHAKYNLALNDSSKTEESVRRAHNELENLHKQIRELETSKENLLSENKRIMNDLTTITREYTSMRSELERSKREVQDLKQQLQSYVDCVKRYEDELARKDHERLEMLEQFRNLSEETAALEQTNLLVESEAKSTQSSLREAESKVEELQRFIEDKERKIKTYHEELNELRFQLSHLEMETSSLREEKSKMENDLYASRDLSTTVLSKNDHLLEQMNALTAHKTAMEAEIAVLKESMNDISKKYRESNRDMQAMHDQISSYEKELSMEVEVNDKLKHEVAALTEQLNQLEAQLRMKSTELERIEKESADNNQEISQLRREMISARYEQTRSDEARRECPVIPPYTFSKIVYCEACVPSNSPDSSKTKQMDLKSFSSTINIADSKASDVSIEKPCTHLPYTSSSPQSCNAWNQKSFHLSCI